MPGAGWQLRSETGMYSGSFLEHTSYDSGRQRNAAGFFFCLGEAGKVVGFDREARDAHIVEGLFKRGYHAVRAGEVERALFVIGNFSSNHRAVDSTCVNRLHTNLALSSIENIFIGNLGSCLV